MADVTIRLYDNGAAGAGLVAIALTGSRSGPGADATLTAVVVTLAGAAPQTYTVAGAVGNQATVPATYLDDTNGPGDVRLVRGPGRRTVTADLIIPDPPTPASPLPSWPFFGRNFAASDPRGGIELTLVLNLLAKPPSVGPAPVVLEEPLAVLGIRGHVEVSPGAGVYASAAVAFRVVIDRLPTFPSRNTPDLVLGLPEGIPWPDVRIPWPRFPTLPGLSSAVPLRLPAFSASLDPLPVRVGWDKIELTLDSSGKLLATVVNLTLAGPGATLSGTTAFDFSTDPLTITTASLLDGLTALTFKNLGSGIFGFDATCTALGKLLGLVSSELSDLSTSPENLKLRLRTTGRELQEVRLDWGIGSTGPTLGLPGFSVDFPAVEMLSLILRRGDPSTDDGDGARVTLAATLAPTAPGSLALKAHSTFCWPLEDGRRENLHDGQGNSSNQFVTLTALIQRRMSLVLCDLPVGGGRGAPARYLHRLRSALATLQAEETGAGRQDTTSFVSGLFDPEPDDPLEVVPLTANDVTLTLTTTDFVLPFLNLDENTFIKLTAVGPLTADPKTLEISGNLNIAVSLFGQTLTGQVGLTFVPQTMSFRVNQDLGLWLTAVDRTVTLVDLKWTFKPNPNSYLIPGSITVDNRAGITVDNALFVLSIKNRNYALRLAPGASIEIAYSRATSEDEPIRFLAEEFALTPKGLDLRAEVTDQPARFNGLETQFKFKSGTLQIHESRVAGFTIAGSGPLPPALVGDAVAEIALLFAQQPSPGDAKAGPVRLVRGLAKIKGSNLLRCSASRFDFSLDGLGLEFVEHDNADHLYFTLSGRARYAPLPDDDPSGPLAWMPTIEIQLIDCPLTGNMRVIAKHINFLVELPRPVSFSFLGCFTFEIRSIGFLAQCDKFLDDGQPTSAMQIGGQVLFADGGGDVLETKVDFHNLYVALPAPGSFVPRLYLKSLAIEISQGDAFDLKGEVEFFNNEPIDHNANGSAILGDGFAGSGSLSIQKMFPMSATFAYLRVSPDGGRTWKKAWFIYLEASQLSIQVPVVEVFLREVGLGFGYRYTLAAIKAVDENNDTRQLLKDLKQLSRTQGNLSDRAQWRVDLENPGEGVHWTIALRGMFSESTAQKGPYGDYDPEKEGALPCLYLLDVVVALRSDLTFFMAGRAWLNTNYQDFLRQRLANGSLPNNPAFEGFVVLSPRQKRLLANLSSNPNAEFGNNPPVPDFLPDAFHNSRFTATLLVQPGLVHYELGWPNQLQWSGNMGPLQVQFRGGSIFQASTTEVVVGNSFLAQGTLAFQAPFGNDTIGGNISATAQVAFGARYIGVLAFRDPYHNSALYGAIGLEINVSLSVDFWVQIVIRFLGHKKTFRHSSSASISVNFTAALEVGILLDPNQAANIPAMRGTATVGISLMGHGLHCNVHVQSNEPMLADAIRITQRFLNVGLEAESAEPVPGTNGSAHAALHASPAPAAAPGGPAGLGLVGAPPVAPAAPPAAPAVVPPVAPAAAVPAVPPGDANANEVSQAIKDGTSPPKNYSLIKVRAPGLLSSNTRRVYFLLIPAADPGDASRFYAVPPDSATFNIATSTSPFHDGIVHDMDWSFPAPDATKVTFEHFDYTRSETDFSPAAMSGATPYAWKVDWKAACQVIADASDPFPPGVNGVPLSDFLLIAYLLQDRSGSGGMDFDLGDPTPTAFSDAQVDERVRNPSLAAYEAAVRGALEQVAAPYFKFDEDSEYDRLLRVACKAETTIYAQQGTTEGLSTPDRKAVEQKRRAIQFRGYLFHLMLRDVQRYAELDGRTDRSATDEMKAIRASSIAFRMGLVFRASGDDGKLSAGDSDELLWLDKAKGTASVIRQRLKTGSTTPDSSSIPVVPFNTFGLGFTEKPPSFSKLRKYEHANTIAFAWELGWPGPKALEAIDDPEHHLSHYRIRRVHVDGNDPPVEFTTKTGALLHLDISAKGTPPPLLLAARFQFVDHFDAESEATPLTQEGKRYLYTIVPVDIAGNESPRPLSVVAARFPCDPPFVPSDGELVVRYELPDDFDAWPTVLSTAPRVREDDMSVMFRWSDPLAPQGETPPVGGYCLYFRRDEALPVGFYGADSYTRGARTDGYPVTNARPLRTDIPIPFTLSDATPTKDKSSSGRPIFEISLDLTALRTNGILPADRKELVQNNCSKAGANCPGTQASASLNRNSYFGPVPKWRPEAWRVFIQTVTPASVGRGVPSSLAAVAIRIEFAVKPATPPPSNAALPAPEARQFSMLEWLPDPIRFDPLPPEDQAAATGFAQVPMPLLDATHPEQWLYPIKDKIPTDSGADANPVAGLRFEAHPERIRALRLTWNQGPSSRTDHPIELHAKYQLFEFDADGQPGEAVESRAVQVTPGDVKSGDTFTLTIRDKSVRLQATADGPANVTAGLAAAWKAATDPAFAGIDAVGGKTSLSLTASKPGVRFTVVGAATSTDTAHTPTLTVTQDLDAWSHSAGLRRIQEVELLPVDDLPLKPADTSNPSGWDVWTPATSRRIVLRRQMIDAGIWPQTTDRTLLGPWYSWRDSYLNWPDPDPQPKPGTLSLVAGGTDANGFTFSSRTTSVAPTWTLTVGTATTTLNLVAGATVDDLVDAVNNHVDAVNNFNSGVWATLELQKPSKAALFRLSVLPPVYEPTTRSTWPCHPFFRALLYAIATDRDDAGLSVYLIELAGGPTRGDNQQNPDPTVTAPAAADTAPGGGQRVNQYPTGSALDTKADPTGMIGFLSANSAEADPHGWGILQRMGLAVGFRVRRRKTGDYVVGAQLAELVRSHLQGVIQTHDSPSIQALIHHLHVEFLFQPGAKNQIGAEETQPNARLPEYADLLALARLSLRPTVTQRIRYQRFTISGNDTSSTPKKTLASGGTRFQLTVSTKKDEVSFLIQTGAPGDPTGVPNGSPVVRQVVMPPGESLSLLVRGPDLSDVTVTATVDLPDPAHPTAPPKPTPLPVDAKPFRPIDWPATFLTVPDEVPWPADTVDPLPPGSPTGPTVAPPSPHLGWSRLAQYLQKVQAGLPCLTDGTWMNPSQGVLHDSTLKPQLLGWLNRFFIEGGDVSAPGDVGPSPLPTGTGLARTGPGPWVTSAYPRTATPMALAPDAAGRITYFHLIEDLWGHTLRYYIRPQGRYDLLWSALSQSRVLFDADRTRGLIDRLQRQVAPPKPGGLDVVLERIRPLAAPLVLSSRRLDPPAPVGQTARPGATWEVLVARHTEQELIERNRTLVDRLGFRQVAHALVRTFAHADTKLALQPFVAQVVSGPFPDRTTPLGPMTFHLVAGTIDTTVTLAAGDTLDNLATKLLGTALGAVATASLKQSAAQPSKLAVWRLIIAPKGAPLKPLQLFVVDGSGHPTPFLSEQLGLDDDRFEAAVNSVVPTVKTQVAPPALPGPLTTLVDHLDLTALSTDQALSIDLPLRSDRFTQGLVALQWQALPFYYTHRLMLVAQASAVCSPITTVDQHDLCYVSPVPIAVMEGLDFGNQPRRRRVVISLARLWDCLPPEAQTRWTVEDPASVSNGDPTSRSRRHSSLPDRDVIYQLIIGRPSGNVEVLAEYRFNTTDPAVCYAALPIPGRFCGDVLRLLPPADQQGVGAAMFRLETLLTETDGPTPAQTVAEPISGRAAFAAAEKSGLVKLPLDRIRVCALRLPDGPLTDPSVAAAVLALAAKTDASFASALRQLISAPGPERYAEACIGLEQLTELNPDVHLDVDATGTQRTLTWPGPVTADQLKRINAWADLSLFSGALHALADALFNGTLEETFPAGDANNPTPPDVASIPGTPVEVKSDRFVRHGLFTNPATAAELTTLKALRAKAGLPAAVGTALDALLDVLTNPSKMKAVIDLANVEPAWKPRPTPATLSAKLAPVLLIGHGVMTFEGLMTHDEGETLLNLPGLSEPDRQAVIRLFAASLNAGLGGGSLEVTARRGLAEPKRAKVLTSIG
jgi:hypothetical protein